MTLHGNHKKKERKFFFSLPLYELRQGGVLSISNYPVVLVNCSWILFSRVSVFSVWYSTMALVLTQQPLLGRQDKEDRRGS